MPNRTVTVRLGVDASDAVAGLRKVAAEARGAAASVKKELGSTKVGVDAGSAQTSFRQYVAAAKAAGAAVKASIGSTKVGVALAPAVSGLRKLSAEAKSTGAGLRTHLGSTKVGIAAGGAVTGLRRIVAEARNAGSGIKTHLGPTVTATVDKLKGSTDRLGGGLGKIGKIGAVGFAAVGAGAIGLGVGLAKAVTKAAGFDKSMRQVGVQTGLSGDKLKAMTDLALEMGEKTTFSAQGASDAMLELAKGGLSAAEMRAGALEQTLTLATAGGLELGAAAGYMVQGLSAFGLEATESGRVAAALAGAANASTTSVEGIGIALAQVGPAARLAGLSIEDTTGALAALTKNGMSGSDAGTSLKTMLTSLEPSTKKAAEAFAELGLLTEDGSSKFYDASGNMKSLAEISGLLENGLRDMSEQQKVATLRAAFGADAFRAAGVLGMEGAKGIAEYTKATSDTDAAQKLAKSATEGFSGAMERFQGSLETAQIQLGTKFLPILSTALDYLSGPGMDTFKAIGGILADTFTPQIDAASGGIQKFFDYLSTNQADVIRTFQDWGNGVLNFGIAVAKMAAGGLRNIGDFTVTATGAVLDMVEFIIRAFDDIPFVDMSDSVESFKKTREEAETMASRVKGGLDGMASTIEDDVIPSVEGMRSEFNKSATTQIFKAEQRDAVIGMGKAFEATTKLIGSGTGQVNSYKDAARELGKTSSDLNKQLGTAKTRYMEAYEAAKDGGAKQSELNEITKGYKTQLLDTLEQMTGNRKEAEKLAKEYGLMPDKVVTDAEFKDKAARASAKEYREYVNEQREKHNILSEAEWDAKKARTDSRTYREYVNDEQAKHKVLSKAEWDRKAAEGSAKAYREYVNAEQKKHKVLSEAEWDAKKAKTDNRTYREYVNTERAKHKTLSKAEFDAQKARENAKAYREYVNSQQKAIDKSVTVKVNWDTEVDKINTKLTMKYGKGARLMAVGGPSLGSSISRSVGAPTEEHDHAPISSANIGAPVSAPTDNDPQSKLGGPSLRQVHSAGTSAVVKHGTGQVSKLLKQLAPQMYEMDSGSPGGKIPTRNVGAGWGPVQAAMRKHGARAFNTYPGHHPSMAMARDVYPHNWGAANAARALSSVWYVIYRMKIASKNHGNGWRQYKPTNFRGDWRHEKHIHVARRYDMGGDLKPGLTVAYNGTRKPEKVITNERWQQLMNTRSGPAKIDSADMARLVEALAHRPAPNLTINNPVREPASRSIATASNYASR